MARESRAILLQRAISLARFSKHHLRKLGVSLCLGQLLSLCLCGTAVTSGILGERGVIIPTAQSFLNYALLCLVYTTLSICFKEGQFIEAMKQRWWKYALLALVDVEANYFVVKAYHYTTVTSVQLLDCLTIPTVLALSWIFLHVRYKLSHFFGVGIALAGVGMLVLADFWMAKDSSQGVNKLLGDFFCLLGAVLYGVSNVGQEFVVKNYNRVEFLGMIGIFGSIINGVQFAIFERKEVASLDLSDYRTALPLLGFTLCLFTLYSLMPVVLEKTSATLVNLNLLSADFYALLVGLFVFHYKFHWLYFVAFVLILLGLLVYSIKPTQGPNTETPTAGEEETQPLCTSVLREGQGVGSHRTEGGTTNATTAFYEQESGGQAVGEITGAVSVDTDKVTDVIARTSTDTDKVTDIVPGTSTDTDKLTDVIAGTSTDTDKLTDVIAGTSTDTDKLTDVIERTSTDTVILTDVIKTPTETEILTGVIAGTSKDTVKVTDVVERTSTYSDILTDVIAGTSTDTEILTDVVTEISRDTDKLANVIAGTSTDTDKLTDVIERTSVDTDILADGENNSHVSSSHTNQTDIDNGYSPLTPAVNIVENCELRTSRT